MKILSYFLFLGNNPQILFFRDTNTIMGLGHKTILKVGEETPRGTFKTKIYNLILSITYCHLSIVSMSLLVHS